MARVNHYSYNMLLKYRYFYNSCLCILLSAPGYCLWPRDFTLLQQKPNSEYRGMLLVWFVKLFGLRPQNIIFRWHWQMYTFHNLHRLHVCRGDHFIGVGDLHHLHNTTHWGGRGTSHSLCIGVSGRVLWRSESNMQTVWRTVQELYNGHVLRVQIWKELYWWLLSQWNTVKR